MIATYVVRTTLIVLGFILGVFGITAYTQIPLRATFNTLLGFEARPMTKLAQISCTTETDDIVFLSCGGIF